MKKISAPSSGEGGDKRLIEDMCKDGGDDRCNRLKTINIQIFMIPCFVCVKTSIGLFNIMRLEEMAVNRLGCR